MTGDRYGGEWPRERFRAAGITYKPSERSRSEIYVELLPLLNSRRVYCSTIRGLWRNSPALNAMPRAVALRLWTTHQAAMTIWRTRPLAPWFSQKPAMAIPTPVFCWFNVALANR